MGVDKKVIDLVKIRTNVFLRIIECNAQFIADGSQQFRNSQNADQQSKAISVLSGSCVRRKRDTVVFSSSHITSEKNKTTVTADPV